MDGCLAAAAVLLLADARAGSYMDARLGVGRRCSAHVFLDLAGHGQKGLFDIAGVLGRCFEEGDAKAVGEFLRKKEMSANGL
jgi:hypothetical protein